MSHDFDAGYNAAPFNTLVANYPGQTAYPSATFRYEWGPMFHRGRLDGSARVLMIGQDPSHNENIVRRILVGEAGRRAQGFLAKLGITTSYVMINTFLYSVYDTNHAATHVKDAKILAYRNQWLDALIAPGKIQAVVALGGMADTAWSLYLKTANGKKLSLPYAHITHPTQPESSGGNNKAKVAAATTVMLQGWNTALTALRPSIANPDTAIPTALYGTAFKATEKPDIPEMDLPAGLPDWMRNGDGWATRKGSTTAATRANITITVPPGVI